MFYFTFFRVNISGVVHCEQGSPTPLLLLFVIFFFCSDSRRFSVGEVGDEPAPGNLSREQESGNEWKRKNLPRVIPSSAFERWQHIFSSSSSRRKKTMHRRKMCFFHLYRPYSQLMLIRSVLVHKSASCYYTHRVAGCCWFPDTLQIILFDVGRIECGRRKKKTK